MEDLLEKCFLIKHGALTKSFGVGIFLRKISDLILRKSMKGRKCGKRRK
jgi:hypothetical protein